MFRAALRPRRVALAVATGFAISTPSSQEPEKLPIYPLRTPDVLLVEESTPLEKHIGIARRAVTETYHDAYAQVQGVVSKWIGVEHAIEHRVKSIIAPDEPLTPALLYVGISTLTGSILARNRGLPTRVLLPPVFLLASLNHFLPKTSANLSGYLSALEETYFPTLAEKHAIANAHSRMTWERVKEGTQSGREGVMKGVEGAVEWVQGATGLKVKETLGWGETQAKKGESVVSEVIHAADKKVEEVKEAENRKLE
ncbi:hypothetical protein CCMSSC00406_0010425 [Pleurotus cornucopiae]|uniref:Uncharacterized protein n=1 Tax=Pleurotus cornucopiae TaxID=5321 RepID=A0ACB7II97_PLECO|nr:hypothetical protein CCMSSC00406_0010425 [Pleurotus cornucopiae]